MRYVLEILQRSLLNETRYRADAIEYLDGGQVSPMTESEKSTREAMLESKRLAEERIPQLAHSIEILQKTWDFFTNAPKEKDSGERPAFKDNVI